MPFDVKEFINDRILFLKCFLNASFMSDIIPVFIYNARMYNLSLGDAGVMRLDVGLGFLIHG